MSATISLPHDPAVPIGGGAQAPATEGTEHPASLKNDEEIRHEVGNALSAASSYARLLLGRMPPGTEPWFREALEAIDANVLRAGRLLLGEVRANSVQLCDLDAVFRQSLAQVPPDRAADIAVNARSRGPITVAADQAVIAQVFVNLLDNATKYSTPGSPIDVELGCSPQQAWVTVRDRGIGIPPAALKSIFDGYRTQEASAMAPGRGIGLRLCRRWVGEIGGNIWATSTPGEGSSIYVTFPLAQSSHGVSDLAEIAEGRCSAEGHQ
jgi:signal transduction histidine kinase